MVVQPKAPEKKVRHLVTQKLRAFFELLKTFTKAPEDDVRRAERRAADREDKR
jgi:hypothetical protein